jgi:Peptidase family M23/S-layer homology domain
MYPIKTTKLYNPNTLGASTDVYTTVYLGNYLAGDYEEEGGSHPGVDIVPMTPNDTVSAVLDGVVVTARNNPSEGNYVIIEHKGVSYQGTVGTYFSCYLHLSTLSIAEWARVVAGQEIGKTGNTGMSTGEHLHFQIDRESAPFHPYWPFSFKEARDLGLGFMEAVNRGLGIENARKHTVNPLVFLDTATNSLSSTSTPSVPPKVIEATVTPSVIRTASVSTPSTGFSDVNRNHPHATAISFVYQKGIVTGQGGKFYPERSVSRAEILKMAYSAAGSNVSTDSASYFNDVPRTHPLLKYINTARAGGVVGGYSDGSFRPDAAVTRAEGLKIALTILGVSLEVVDAPVYADVGRKDWIAPFALWSRELSVLARKGGVFAPNTALSRAEVAEIIYRALQK